MYDLIQLFTVEDKFIDRLCFCIYVLFIDKGYEILDRLNNLWFIRKVFRFDKDYECLVDKRINGL